MHWDVKKINYYKTNRGNQPSFLRESEEFDMETKSPQQGIIIQNENDKHVSCAISEDKMFCELILGDIEDSYAIAVVSMKQFLEKCGVYFGLKIEVMEAISKAPIQFKNTSTVVAVGLPVENGLDGQINYTFESASGLEKKPLELDDGTVDYKEITKLNNVRRGELIATRTLATEGKPGKTVKSEEIPNKP